jgi:hypothetical protein
MELIMPRKSIDFHVVREIARALPDVQEHTIHGAPSLKLRGKLLACPALHASAEPDSLVVRMDIEQRAKLIAADPSVYYVTHHYVSYPMVLVRLSSISRSALSDLLGKAWQSCKPKKKSGILRRKRKESSDDD